MEDLGLIYIALATFCGGVLSAILGFLDSHESFDTRKFGKSIITAFVAGLLFALGYSFANGIGVKDIIIAILGGAGCDSITNRSLGAIFKKK